MSSGLYVFYDWHSRHRRDIHQYSSFFNKPTSNLTTEIARLLGILMLQTILFIDTKSLEWRFITPAFPSIPSIFKSIGEVRGCLHSCICSIYHEILSSQLQVITLISRLLPTKSVEDSQTSKPLPFPAFAMSILPPLYFAASRCRHPSIWRQAYQLLRKGLRQEGIWYKDILTSIARRIITIEEIGCGDVRSSMDILAHAKLSVISAEYIRQEEGRISLLSVSF
jgi:hypothetical protein